MDCRVRRALLVFGLLVLVAVVPGLSAAESHGDDRDPPPDPETDVLGWEAGYWYNETLPVDPADGFNESELNATVARSMARVERIRGLEFNETVPVAIETRERYRNRTRNGSVDPALRTFDNAKFEALFLVGESTDSIEVQRENRGGSTLGFYDFSADRITVISPSDGPVSVNELTLAHELAHALQDQRFNLSRYRRVTRDGANGVNGLLEGDPSYIEYRYRQRCGEWAAGCFTSAGDGVATGGGIAHVGVQAVMIQPYSDGPSFVRALLDRGGWAAVNAAYDRPPVSAEQVIHPSRYPEGVPSNVSLPDRADASWSRVRPPNRPAYETFGEASLVAMLVYPAYDSGWRTRIIPPEVWFNNTGSGLSEFDPLNYDTDYTDGWDGDRFHAYENPVGETAYVWRLHWATETDANEFVYAYRRVLSYWGAERVGPSTWVIRDGEFADAYRLVIRGRTVTIVNAPTRGELNDVWPPRATPGPTDPETGVEATRVTTELTRIPPTAMRPVSPGSSPGTSSGPGQPGFGFAAGFAAVLLVALAAARRGG